MINSSTELENLHVSPPDAKPVLPAVLPFVNEVACIDWEDGIKQVFDNTIDLVLTDPPYGMAYRMRTNLNRITNLTVSTTTAIFYSRCYLPFLSLYYE